ncbi:hypothetical protein [Vibrio hepatarius]|uniref:hypothetical protein n=1 Tax=Vibrio hepatarius TaxID=171383 RepID=UPI001C09C22F|nr:hypothetical protein [Vibrio hepatarius]MBU2895547.1 hypothetical protein [Vibrio hepatarius]
MTKDNHHIDETEFGSSVGISHLMMEKGEIFYSSERDSINTQHSVLSAQWKKIKRRLRLSH